MTTIVGVETDRGVMLGGDSRLAIDGSFGFISDAPKVWRVNGGGIVAGATGTVRRLQSIKYFFTVEKMPKDYEIEEYLATDFVNALREAFAAGGISNGEDEWSLLIGIQDKLYCLDAAMGISRSHMGFFAIGSGSDFALGSLLTTAALCQYAIECEVPQMMMTPEARLHYALASAAEYGFGTAPPFIYENNYPYAQLTLIEGEDNEDSGSRPAFRNG
jgi:ATP-dependent protease HslVU (ClpYQ) peptidase subunit